MANANSISSNTQLDLLDAIDKLAEAKALASFVQAISTNGGQNRAITLHPAELTGLYFTLQNTIDRIKEAEALIETARNQPVALAA